jgi:biopolymer transport protein ExbB
MLELFIHAGWVAWPLGLCSILALGVMLERAYTLSKLKTVEDRAFMILQLALEKGDTAPLRDSELSAAPVSQILDTLSEMRGASTESLFHAADIALSLQRMRLRRYLGTLATIASTAPFIGLFGTVIGIMIAFQGMSTAGLSGEAMAKGISEALSATALGLVVAVPSLIAYNYYLGRVQNFSLSIQSHVSRLAPLLGNLPAESSRERVGARA